MLELNERVKRCIIERLELQIEPSSISDEAPLFEPLTAGGIELDSLAAIEIVVALGVEFNLQLDEVPREAFASIKTLSDYVERQLEADAI
jgi:acyl carrier protein